MYGLIRQEEMPRRKPNSLGGLPPGVGPGGRRDEYRAWRQIAWHLKTVHPGEWWVVDEGARYWTMSEYASRIRKGVSWWHPAGRWDAGLRTVNGVPTMYVRFRDR